MSSLGKNGCVITIFRRKRKLLKRDYRTDMTLKKNDGNADD